jgi:hypothetical protein
MLFFSSSGCSFPVGAELAEVSRLAPDEISVEAYLARLAVLMLHARDQHHESGRRYLLERLAAGRERRDLRVLHVVEAREENVARDLVPELR